MERIKKKKKKRLTSCSCDNVATVKICSNIESKNLGRKFYSCKQNECRFFGWLDTVDEKYMSYDDIMKLDDDQRDYADRALENHEQRKKLEMSVRPEIKFRRGNMTMTIKIRKPHLFDNDDDNNYDNDVSQHKDQKQKQKQKQKLKFPVVRKVSSDDMNEESERSWNKCLYVGYIIVHVYIKKNKRKRKTRKTKTQVKTTTTTMYSMIDGKKWNLPQCEHQKLLDLL